MSKYIYVGLDVHKESIVIAWCRGGRGDQVYDYGKVSGSVTNLERVLRKLAKREGFEFKRLRVCYEAGPCGYVIYRRLTALGLECAVVVPNLIPSKAGERVKTDRRDARKLCQMHRWGELTLVVPPDVADERMRDLVRARADAVRSTRTSRQQLGGFLLRHGIIYPGKTQWTVGHMRYLRELSLDDPQQKAVLEEYLIANQMGEERITRLEQHMLTHLADWKRKVLVEALMGLRGFRITNAMVVVAELGDPCRFKSPEALMNYLGLVVSEYSTGKRRRPGGITKTGNAHARRALIEAAWAYRLSPKVNKELSLRLEKAPDYIRPISWKAQNRLHHKYRRMVAKGKPSQKATVAVARELAGFIWSVFDVIHRNEAVAKQQEAA